MPPVAYVVCCFRHSVEIWPTAAIAFPRWGVVRAGQEFVVGQARVTIDHPSISGNVGDVSENEHDVDERLGSRRVGLPIQVYWGDKMRACQLNRPVTIMGRDQPSMLRLAGQQLDRCDHALVVADNQLWLADLSKPVASSSSAVTCLTKPGDAGRIGDVHLARRGTEQPLPKDPEVLNVKHVATRHPAVIHAFRASVRDVEPFAVGASTTSNATDEKADARAGARRGELLNRMMVPAQIVAASRDETNRGQRVEFQGAPMRMEHRKDEIRREAESDHLAARVTDRLVRMSRQKGIRERGLLNTIFDRVLSSDSKVA